MCLDDLHGRAFLWCLNSCATVLIVGRPATATVMLAALASARGWTTGAGLPDEARAGRQVPGFVIILTAAFAPLSSSNGMARRQSPLAVLQ